jgi:hypothetical protein
MSDGATTDISVRAMDLEITLRVDGAEHRLTVGIRTTLLDALRERATTAGRGCLRQAARRRLGAGPGTFRSAGRRTAGCPAMLGV